MMSLAANPFIIGKEFKNVLLSQSCAWKTVIFDTPSAPFSSHELSFCTCRTGTLTEMDDLEDVDLGQHDDIIDDALSVAISMLFMLVQAYDATETKNSH